MLPPRRPHLLAPLVGTALLGACAGIDPIETCPNDRCVEGVLVAPFRDYLLPGDTLRLRADVRTRGGVSAEYRWVARQPEVVTVSASGLATAQAPGLANVLAVPAADSTRFGYTALLVLGPDSTTVPAFTSLRDAATGAYLWSTEVDGRDSVDVGLSWVVGASAGEQPASAELRVRGAGRDTTFAIPLAGGAARVARAAVRLRPAARTAAGTPAWPRGWYEVRAVLRLGDGRVLGENQVLSLLF
jgi:hypothetical protein